jgi:hypothetical protein
VAEWLLEWRLPRRRWLPPPSSWTLGTLAQWLRTALNVNVQVPAAVAASEWGALVRGGWRHGVFPARMAPPLQGLAVAPDDADARNLSHNTHYTLVRMQVVRENTA